MEWPSDRVARGGLYQPAKVTYSPETKKFLKELMYESKLSMMQRDKINYSLRSGEPLPSLSHDEKKVKKPPEVIIRPMNNKRRNLASIVESGAYVPDRYVPTKRGVDRDYAKKYLQDFMAYGQEVKEEPKKRTTQKKKNEMNRFDELKQEIKDRQDWLADMEKLGEGPKYKMLIDDQIAARIREMKTLKLTESDATKQTEDKQK